MGPIHRFSLERKFLCVSSTFIYSFHKRDFKLAFSLGSVCTLQSEMCRQPTVSAQCHAGPDRAPTISQDLIRTLLKAQCVKLHHLSVAHLLSLSPLSLATHYGGLHTSKRVSSTSMFWLPMKWQASLKHTSFKHLTALLEKHLMYLFCLRWSSLVTLHAAQLQ